MTSDYLRAVFKFDVIIKIIFLIFLNPLILDVIKIILTGTGIKIIFLFFNFAYSVVYRFKNSVSIAIK